MAENMTTLFRQIKDLFFCKIGWHNPNDDGQCEHCKAWHCKDCEDKWLASTQKPVAYIHGDPIYQRDLDNGRCIHGEFWTRCPICRR